MNADLFYSVLKQPALLKEVSEQELEQIVNEYPWFGAAQFLLAVKKRKNSSAGANQQLQKASLHFNHSLWMNWQLGQFENEKLKKSEISFHSDLQQPVSVEEAVLPKSTIEESSIANETDAMLDAEAMAEATDEAELQQQEPLTNIQIAEELVHTANAIQQKTEAQHLKENDLSFTFEPYHTVDYFASQGIKLQEEKLAADKLGQQVKTFTQWLKSMKKIYVEDGRQLDADKEKAVVNMATESNQKEEIITETMANVLLQQGKKEKAIELFEKLILLHPEKSGYFATQIEELKQ